MTEKKMEIAGKNVVRAYVRAESCPICGKTAIMPERAIFYRSIYHTVGEFSQRQQMEGTGIVFLSDVKIDDEYVCVECVEAGRAKIICALCKKEKSLDKIKESFGDPPEYLCKDCYSTVPVQKWDAVVEGLRADHRWDFE